MFAATGILLAVVEDVEQTYFMTDKPSPEAMRAVQEIFGLIIDGCSNTRAAQIIDAEFAEVLRPPENADWEAVVKFAYADEGDGCTRINRITADYNRMRQRVAETVAECDSLRQQQTKCYACGHFHGVDPIMTGCLHGANTDYPCVCREVVSADQTIYSLRQQLEAVDERAEYHKHKSASKADEIQDALRPLGVSHFAPVDGVKHAVAEVLHLRQQLEAARADNAALLIALREAEFALTHYAENHSCDWAFTELQRTQEALAAEHPGAALLETQRELMAALKRCRAELYAGLTREGYEDKYALPIVAPYDVLLHKLGIIGDKP